MSDDLKENAQKEMERMKEIFDNIEVSGKGLALDFYQFARAYFDDGIHFFEKKKFLQSFEAFIISWAYIDAGLKLKYFKVKENQKHNFTSE